MNLKYLLGGVVVGALGAWLLHAKTNVTSGGAS